MFGRSKEVNLFRTVDRHARVDPWYRVKNSVLGEEIVKQYPFFPEKTTNISWRHHWFPPDREMTSGKRVHKFHTDDVSLVEANFHRGKIKTWRIMAVQYLCRVLWKLFSTSIHSRVITFFSSNMETKAIYSNRGNAEKTRCLDWLRKWSENISQLQEKQCKSDVRLL